MSVKWQCDGFLRELVGSDLLIFVQQNQDIRTNSCHPLVSPLRRSKITMNADQLQKGTRTPVQFIVASYMVSSSRTSFKQ
jgi:hypothetical protein